MRVANKTAAPPTLNGRAGNPLLGTRTEVLKLRSESGKPLRRRLTDTRQAFTHKFDIAGHEGYLTVGLFDDGQPGELFITMAKEGSTIGGLMDSIGTLTSMALQYGVPLDALVRKFAHQRFEPSGFTKNPDIRNASSITDYVFRWLALQFIPGYRESVTVARTQPELAMPGLEAEIKKKVNRPVPELPIAEDNTDIVEIKSGNGHGHDRRAATLDFDDHQPAGRADVPELRQRRRPQRRMLQMPELRRKSRLLVKIRCPKPVEAFKRSPASTLSLF